jgi:hypothetical protein
MQWVTKHLSAPTEAEKPQISIAPSSPAFLKTARLSGPLSGDAFTFTLSKMKLDGFTGVIVSITPEDWRLQRHVIVSLDHTLTTLQLHTSYHHGGWPVGAWTADLRTVTLSHCHNLSRVMCPSGFRGFNQQSDVATLQLLRHFAPHAKQLPLP